MSRFPWLRFSLLVLIDLAVWLLQKRAAANSFAAEAGDSFFLHVLFDWNLWLALVGAVAQLALWRTVLQRADLSAAFPLLSVSYPLALLASRFVLGEEPNVGTWCGALLVMGGVMLLSSAETATAPHDASRNNLNSDRTA